MPSDGFDEWLELPQKKTRPSMRRWPTAGALLGLTILIIQGFGTPARGQGAVAFDPIVAPAFSGETLTVTPAVSPDRRYVRLSVNAYFQAINGFTNVTSSLGAVSGGGGAGGINAGMNGVIGQPGLGGGRDYGQVALVGQSGELRAGPLPPDGALQGEDAFLIADALNASVAPEDGWQEGDQVPAQTGRLVAARSAKRTAKNSATKQRTARKSSHRKSSSAARLNSQ
jgi:hypothetical protein